MTRGGEHGGEAPPRGADPYRSSGDERAPARRRSAGMVVLLVLLAVVLVIGAGALLRLRAGSPAPTASSALERSGGTVVVLALSPRAGDDVGAAEVDRVLAVLRGRVAALGVDEAEVVARGTGSSTTIEISLVGLKDTAAARSLARGTALELRPVADVGYGSAEGTSAPPVAAPFAADADGPGLRSRFRAAVCSGAGAGPGPAATQQWIVACSGDGSLKYLLEPVALGGDHVTGARVVAASDGSGYQIEAVFDPAGAEQLASVTARLAALSPPRNQLALVLDSRVSSAPSVVQAIVGGAVQITGSFTSAEAQALAEDIRGGLPVAVTVTEVRVVQPSGTG